MSAGRLAGATSALAAWSASHPRPVLIAAALLVAVSIVSIARAPFSTSLGAMLGDATPSAAALARVAARYHDLDNLLVIARVKDDALPAAAARAALLGYAERLHAALAADPDARAMVAGYRDRADPQEAAYIRDVVLPAGAFYLTDNGFNRLLERLQPREMRRALARGESLISAPGPAASALARNLLRDPLRLAELIEPGEQAGDGGGDFSADGRSLLIRIEGRSPSSDLEFSVRFSAAVARVIGGLAAPGITAELGGSYAIAAFTSSVIRADSIRATLLSVALLLAVFAAFYRALMAPVVICTTAAVGILAGFGVYSALGWPLTPLTAVVGAVLAGLGVDYGIHFLSNYRTQQARGLPHVAAVRGAMLHVGPATTANCVTSMVGFVAVGPSGIAALRDFSVIGTLGLAGSLLAVFLLMPAILPLTGRTRQPGRTGAVAARITASIARGPRITLTLGLLLTLGALAAAAAGGFRPTLGSDLTVIHPRPNPPLDATEAATRTFESRGETIAVEIRAATFDELLARSHDAARALAAPPLRDAGVRSVAGLPLLLPDPRTAPARAARLAGLNPEAVLADFDAAVAATAFDPAAFTDYRGFLRRLVSARTPPAFTDLRRYPALAGRVLPDSGEPGTVLVVRFGSPLSTRTDRDAAVLALRSALAPIPGATPTGMSVLGYDLEQATRAALPRSLALSVGLVIGSLIVFLRTPLGVALSLIPLLFGALATYAVIVAAGVPLNPVNAAGLPLLAGIAVDAGVYIVAAARDHAPGVPWLAATLHAVLAASITTVTGFGSLLWTHTPAVRSLGLLTSIGITAALVGVILILIPALALLRGRGVRV
ncbi:MAG: MMPL family transporter [Phycisphaerales bacterium]|nr:MMPL family transporter [Phycisphaerales bacterium]